MSDNISIRVGTWSWQDYVKQLLHMCYTGSVINHVWFLWVIEMNHQNRLAAIITSCSNEQLKILVIPHKIRGDENSTTYNILEIQSHDRYTWFSDILNSAY